VEVQFQKDPRLYARLCAEVFLYLYQREVDAQWRGVVIYPNRQVEPPVPVAYRELVEGGRIQRVYLEEVRDRVEGSVGVGIIGLVVEPEETAGATAQRLITRTRAEVEETSDQAGLIELIEQIMVYKFPGKSREEVERMLGVSDLKKTRVYQEAREEGIEEGRLEGRLEAIEMGLELKFGVEGLRLLPEIRKIKDGDILRAISEGIKAAKTLDELRRIYGDMK